MVVAVVADTTMKVKTKSKNLLTESGVTDGDTAFLRAKPLALCRKKKILNLHYANGWK